MSIAIITLLVHALAASVNAKVFVNGVDIRGELLGLRTVIAALTAARTTAPTPGSTGVPTATPTASPTRLPTAEPTTGLPTAEPTTLVPTGSPTAAPYARVLISTFTVADPRWRGMTQLSQTNAAVAAGGRPCSGHCNSSPPFAGYQFVTHVEGTVSISSAQSLQGLDGGAPALRVVAGSFVLNQNDALTTLGNGFARLQEIDSAMLGHGLTITLNTALTTLGNGFAALRVVGGYITIGRNWYLTSMGTAFSALRRVGYFLEISLNLRLPSLGDAFSALEEVGLSNPGWIMIRQNAALTTLGDGFAALRMIPRNLAIQNNHALTSLGTAFRSLRRVVGELYIHDNPLLTDFEALRNLTCHGGISRCQNCPDWLINLSRC